jgi:hypothetical protein
MKAHIAGRSCHRQFQPNTYQYAVTYGYQYINTHMLGTPRINQAAAVASASAVHCREDVLEYGRQLFVAGWAKGLKRTVYQWSPDLNRHVIELYEAGIHGKKKSPHQMLKVFQERQADTAWDVDYKKPHVLPDAYQIKTKVATIHQSRKKRLANQVLTTPVPVTTLPPTLMPLDSEVSTPTIVSE